ncbi:major facilitator superfamily transporter [Rhizoctonia solani]|uniref:Major facilitator superfamily transporter n=1 Tax=Rhizoctonia solani TaxID=456999 RepID=A0A8H8NUZ7_9AGAM|nr:major facilitator superfamily transporter [Rhizoctonia solani]QRW18662.1 major facilitator superfamily transporter [Rhizoctonia solani]
MFICLAEPIAATVIYPFIIDLVNSLGVTGGDDSKVGYYAGMIESIFFLTETCLIFHYGRLSDRVGRRPVVLLGLFGLAFSIVSFGLSRTFIGLVISRALSGALNGNAGVIKSIVAELTDSTNQAQGFALLSVTWYLGSTLGPLIGGSLSKPAERFPGVFGSRNHVWTKLGIKGFWSDYPYFLPCFVAAGVAACAWCVALLFLRETLPAKRIHLVRKATSEYGTITWDTERAPPEDPCPVDGLKAVMTPRVAWAISNFMLLALADVAWVVLQPLVFATHRAYWWNPSGTMFQKIYARFGAINVYRAALASYAFMFISFTWMVRLGLDESSMGWLVLGAHVAVSCVASLGYGCTYILITAASPSRALLGTTNGLAQTSCSLIRALGPAGAASLFAYSSGEGGRSSVDLPPYMRGRLSPRMGHKNIQCQVAGASVANSTCRHPSLEQATCARPTEHNSFINVYQALPDTAIEMSDERQPLLEPAHNLGEDAVQATEVASTSTERQSHDEHKPPTPLPKKQIAILLLMQLSEPIAYSVIYPFIVRLVNETGVTDGDESKVGYYAGMIESIFFLTESLFTLQYGRVSDRIGRRPVLMFGLFGQAVSIFSVGLSKRYWQLVFSRAISGALNGNTGVAKSMVVELTDETNQAQAFAFIPIVWSAGSTLGPFVGGTLSHPAKLLPSMFDTPFWHKYPYFLPCLVAAIYAACVCCRCIIPEGGKSALLGSTDIY